MQKNESYVYIMASKKYGTLYIGITSDIVWRIYEHKEKRVEGFTKKYNIDKLVYFETYTDINEAIFREKQIKKWRRDWKINLIEQNNPYWQDLYHELIG